MFATPILLLLATAASDPEVCITLRGPPALVDEVRAALHIPEPCRRVEVRVERVDGALLVATTEASRRVSTARMAATVVESWATPPAFGEVVPPPGPRPSMAAAPTGEVVEIEAPARREARVGIAVLGEAGIAEGDASMGGLLVRGDVRFDDLFLWGGARFAFAPRYGVGSYWDSRRIEGALLAGAEFRFRLGPVSIAPGLATGVNVVRAETIDFDRSRTSPGLVFEAGLRGEIPLADALALELFASADYLPMARGREIDPAVALTLGPRASPDPRWVARLGLGIRWGL